MKLPVIHIGMLRSGSTLLQHKLFSQHSMIHNIWKPVYEELLRQMINVEDNEIPKKKIYQLINKNSKIAKKKNKIIFASNEQIAGLPTLSFAARRIKEFFPKAKILFIIRKQENLIESLYSYQYRNLAGFLGVPARFETSYLSFDEYFNFQIPSGMELEHKSQKIFQLAWRLKYSNVINLYENLYGKANVIALPFEMIINDLQIFAERLENFCKLEKDETIKLLRNVQKLNESVQTEHILYERLRNKIPVNFPIKKFLPFAGFIQRKVKNFLQTKKQLVINWDATKRERIKKLYKIDNQKIDLKYNISLSKYDYTL